MPETEDFPIDDVVLDAFRDLLDEEEIEFTDEELDGDRLYVEANIRRLVASKLWGTEVMYRVGFHADYQLQRVIELFEGARTTEDLLARVERENGAEDGAELAEVSTN